VGRVDRPLVVLDTENAAARGAPHLVEIGAVRVADGEVVEHFCELVRPQAPVDPETTEIHGLADDDLRAADDAGVVLARFFGWVGDDWMAAHRAEVDAWVLSFEAARHGLALPSGPLLDTLRLARKLIPEAPDHRLDTLAGQLELEHGGRHRALGDAVACWKVLEECARRLRPDRPATAGELLAGCSPPVTLPGAAPRTPRLAARLRALEPACRDGRTVELFYGEPPQAPAWLSVRPRMLYATRHLGYLEAECARSGLLKTYRLDRVRRVIG
jgi:DNA polymerase III epsilon subunit-like protein